MSGTTDATPLLSVRGLRTYFSSREGVAKAVDGVSFDVYPGETLGLVGESGSGKSVTCLSVVRLVPGPAGRIVEGEVLLEGQDVLKLSNDEMARIRGSRQNRTPKWRSSFRVGIMRAASTSRIGMSPRPGAISW